MKRSLPLLLVGLFALAGLALIVIGIETMVADLQTRSLMPCGMMPGSRNPPAVCEILPLKGKHSLWGGTVLVSLAIAGNFWLFFKSSK